MENYENQNRQPTARRKKKSFSAINAITYVIFILGVSTLLSTAVIFLSNDVFAFVKENKTIMVKIPEKATVGQVAKILDKQGVVNYGSLFNLFVAFSTKNAEFNEGEYSLNSKMDYRAILNTLRKSADSKTTVSITIPEGYTIAQIKAEILKKKVCSESELVDVLTNYKFNHDFLPNNLPQKENRLEGYLFPDTYQFYVGDKAVTVINKMLNNFGKKLDDGISEKAKELDMSVRDVVTLASLIEREAKLEDEQVKISGVIHNRLNSSKYPYLNIDATIQYAVGHKEELTKADLEIDDPYNTYKYKGLPPGPIANPGFSALYAAVNPEKNDYYFYVAALDGSHIFSRTLSEHNAAIAKVNKEKKK